VEVLYVDYGFWYQLSAAQNVEHLGGGANLVDEVARLVLLLVEEAVEVQQLDVAPLPEEGQRLQVLLPLALLDLLYVLQT